MCLNFSNSFHVFTWLHYFCKGWKGFLKNSIIIWITIWSFRKLYLLSLKYLIFIIIIIIFFFFFFFFFGGGGGGGGIELFSIYSHFKKYSTSLIWFVATTQTNFSCHGAPSPLLHTSALILAPKQSAAEGPTIIFTHSRQRLIEKY